MKQLRLPDPTPALPPTPAAAIAPDTVHATAKGVRPRDARKIDCGERAAARAKPGRKEPAAAAQVCDARPAAERRKGPGH